MNDILDLDDGEAAPWLNSQMRRLHVVLGDSVARDSGLSSTRAGDRVLNLARGGATWSSLYDRLEDMVAEWRRSARVEERLLGTAILWLSDNDVYNKRSGLPSASEAVLDRMAGHASDVTHVVKEMAEEVWILGPIARLSSEVLPVQWEDTAAFAMERRLLHSLPKGVNFVPVGRQLTKKMRRRPHCVSDCGQWYGGDGVHLNSEGYEKVAKLDRLPEWKTLCGGH